MRSVLSSRAAVGALLLALAVGVARADECPPLCPGFGGMGGVVTYTGDLQVTEPSFYDTSLKTSQPVAITVKYDTMTVGSRITVKVFMYDDFTDTWLPTPVFEITSTPSTIPSGTTVWNAGYLPPGYYKVEVSSDDATTRGDTMPFVVVDQ